MSTQLICVSDYEEEAKKILPKAVYDYYRSGADRQQTLADNTAAFDRYRTPTTGTGHPPQVQDTHHRYRTPTTGTGHPPQVQDTHHRYRTPTTGGVFDRGC
ncbi:hypothetical protein CRUP_006480 [Coryphaenoides rupestris]|nr:hypothetical protein CRUP_006480 [Coryphaenoides rupestris]